jgi:glycosyltransferase involved in cell wall biosynthesis
MVSMEAESRIAVLIPCFREETTVGQVVRAFRRELPDAGIWVYDNGSDDRTVEAAREAGASVRIESRRGKGNVVQAMLRDVDADYFVLVDGDSTYPAESVHDLLAPLRDGSADQVVGARRAAGEGRPYPAFHPLGNLVVTFLVNRIFGTRLEDVMSGYRAFHREVARNVPLTAAGFDMETEWTLQTLEKGFTVTEVPVAYRERPEGSHSKLSTIRDGVRVLWRILTILKDFRPLAFFGGLAALSAVLSLLCGVLPVMEYVRERYVHRVPLAVLAGFLGTIALGLLQTGVVLSSLNNRLLEMHRLRRRRSGRDPHPPS